MVETELIITLWAHIHSGVSVTMRCLLLWRVFLVLLPDLLVLPQGWGVLGNSQMDFRLHAVWVQLLEFSISISSVKFNSVSSYMGFYLFICSLICLSNVIAIVCVLKTIIFLFLSFFFPCFLFFLFLFSLSFFLNLTNLQLDWNSSHVKCFTHHTFCLKHALHWHCCCQLGKQVH